MLDIQKNESNKVQHHTDHSPHFWSEVYFVYQTHLLCIIVGFSCIYISQNNIATQLTCDGIFSNRFIANCPQNAPVKEF